MGPLVKNYEEQYLGYATGFASLQGAELKVWGGCTTYSRYVYVQETCISDLSEIVSLIEIIHLSPKSCLCY